MRFITILFLLLFIFLGTSNSQSSDTFTEKAVAIVSAWHNVAANRSEAVKYFHPEALGEFKRYMVQLESLSGSSDRRNALRKYFLLPDSLKNLSEVDSLTLYVSFLQSPASSIKSQPYIPEPFEIIGSIRKGSDTVFVVYQVTTVNEQFSTKSTEVVSVIRNAQGIGMTLFESARSYLQSRILKLSIESQQH